MLGNSRTWKMHSVRRTPVALESHVDRRTCPQSRLAAEEQGSQHSDALLRRLPLRLASCTVCVRVDDGHNVRAQGRLCNHRSLSTRLAKGIRLLPHYTKSFVGSCPASEDSRGSTQSFDQAFMSMLRSCFMLLLFIQSHAGHLRQDHSKTLGQASKLPV